jgi:transposase-like protein
MRHIERFAESGCSFIRAIDSVGDTVEFRFSEHRDLTAAMRFFNNALDHHGRPDRVVIDGSQTNREACDTTLRLRSETKGISKPVTIRTSKYLNNRIEQDHRRIKHRTRPMLGFKSPITARIILSGIELIHMMPKRQARFSFNPNPSLASSLMCWQRKLRLLDATDSDCLQYLRRSLVAERAPAAPYGISPARA